MGYTTETRKVKCKKCAGTGFYGRSLNEIGCCNMCNGSGTVKRHGCK
jgi:hypothetical protein